MLSIKTEVLNKTKGKPPSLPFEKFKEKILGKKYNLSIVFVTSKEIKSINQKYRKINKPTDILSFSLEDKGGEIILCPTLIKKKAKEFGTKVENYFPFLFIHGLLHLKGFDHSSKMKEEEKKWCKFFSIDFEI